MKTRTCSSLLAASMLVTLAAGCGGRVDDPSGDDLEAGAPRSEAGTLGTDALSTAAETAGDVVAADSEVGSDPDGSDGASSITAADCAGPGNVIALWGDVDDSIYVTAQHVEPGARPGGVIIRGGDGWEGFVSLDNWAEVYFFDEMRDWQLFFTTEQLHVPLTTGVFTDAQRASFADAGHAGLEVSGDGRGCNQIAGTFEITELVHEGKTLKAFTATFEQHCEKMKPALRGCVHFEQ